MYKTEVPTWSPQTVCHVILLVRVSGRGLTFPPITALLCTHHPITPSLSPWQLIIITGPSYEALASEGLNMEEVTCTVIGGVAYDQVCQSDTELREAEEDEEEDEESISGQLVIESLREWTPVRELFS